MKSGKAPRPYESPLRAEQAEQTRSKLIEATTELLCDEGLSELTVAAVAKRAGVARRTAYRYFPTLDALIDAYNKHVMVHRDYPRPPDDPKDMGQYAADLYGAFSRQERLTRAYLESRPARAVRQKRKPEQVRFITELFAGHVEDWEGRARPRVAIMHALSGSDTFLHLRDNWGLSADEAAEVVRWAIDLIFSHLDDEPPSV